MSIYGGKKEISCFPDSQTSWQSKPFAGTSKFIATMPEINVMNP